MPPAAPRPNRLQHETSPYLLQHAHNPVDWYPWGEEALARARRDDRPIFLSIGYAACHWCHVMERESFEDEAVARLMNEHFVCIKVDREERPDIDDIYMAATVAMSGSGGWPMSVFLAPDQRPFFAGTYFPKRDAHGRPGFSTLLTHIAELWRSDRGRVLDQAQELTAMLTAREEAAPAAAIAFAAIEEATRQLARSFDPKHGGFSRAPKFPAPASLSLLLRHHDRTGDPQALQMAVVTLDAMMDGGIYDHVGGGFARYSTDDRWLVPHFEKMIYDNAQLVRVYLEAHQLTGADAYRRVATETLDYVVREMQGEHGGYFSATDADSEGEEGKFFVFTPDDLDAILPPAEARRFAAFYDVTKAGNWEGKSILHKPRSLEEVAKDLGDTAEDLRRSLAESRAKVYAARRERVPPLCDDKVLAAWNGLMIGAMAEGYRVLRDPRYLESATRAARFVTGALARPDGGLFRTARSGKAHLDAYLEDYAFLADALVDLYEAGGSSTWLDEAERLADRMVSDFADPDGGAFFQTAHGHEKLLLRSREGQDGATPNANAVAAHALVRLAAHRGREDFRALAERAIAAYGLFIGEAPRAFCHSLRALERLLEGPVELAFVGDAAVPAAEALWTEAARHFLRHALIAHATTGLGDDHPLLAGKTTIEGAPALYVCRDFTCRAPVTDAASVEAALVETRAERPAQAVLAPASARGRATPEGTRRFAERKNAGRGDRATTTIDGLSIGRLGLSTARARDDDAVRAARAAIDGGVQWLESSPHASEGASARALGLALVAAFAEGACCRDEIVVAVKAGYATGADLLRARAADKDGHIELVAIDAATGHCLDPAWLHAQLDRALASLGVTFIDFCLVHDPERQRGSLPAHLTRAFRCLEERVAAGTLGAYGVASDAWRGAAAPSGDATPRGLDLRAVILAAREAGGDDHHLRVVSVPLNLAEPAARAPGGVLDVARDLGLGVIVHRPLTAQGGPDGPLRLVDPPVFPEGLGFDEALDRLASIEDIYRQEIGRHLSVPAGSPIDPRSWLRYAGVLRDAGRAAASLGEVSTLATGIVGKVAQEVRTLDQSLPRELGEVWGRLRARYDENLEATLVALQRDAAARDRGRADELRGRLVAAGGRADRSLAQLALAPLVADPRIAVVVVGMTRAGHVDEAMAILADPPSADERAWTSRPGATTDA